MCSIIDANVLTTEFRPHDKGEGNKPKTAGEVFYEKVHQGKLKVVVGGQLLREPENTKDPNKIHNLWRELIRAGLAKQYDDNTVNTQTQTIRNQGGYKSNDPHIIALAQVSGARLLYTNDDKLHKDFGNKSLIDNPRGRVYSTLRGKKYTRVHQELLARKDLCQLV